MINSPTTLLLFLGSGVSYPSGLPGVDAITESIFSKEWRRHTTGCYLPGRDPLFAPETEVLQEFLRRLKEYADLYYLSRRERKANYEDLFYLAQQLGNEEQGGIDNPAISSFLTEVKSKTGQLSASFPPSNPFLHLVLESLRLIQSVIHHELRTPEQIVGLDLVVDLAKSDAIERLDIVTLNHDLLIEVFLAKHGVAVCDGFGQPLGHVRHLAPNVYENGARVRLFKLHGSLNWYGFRRSTAPEEFYGIPINGDVDHCKDEHGKFLMNMTVQPLVLAGTHNKIMRYGCGIFAEMQYWFHRLLKEHNKIALSGYGWKDLGVNRRLVEWLEPANGQQMYLMHQQPDDLAQRSNSGMLSDYYGLLTSEGRLIPIPKWMQAVTSEELLTHMQSQHGGIQ